MLCYHPVEELHVTTLVLTQAACYYVKMNWCCMESFFSSLGVQELLLIYGGICEFLGGLRWLCVYCMSEAFLHWKPAGGWLAFVRAPRPVLVPFTIKILQTCKVSNCKSNFSVIHKKCSGAQLCKTKKWKEAEMECCSVKVQSITMKGRMCFYYGSDKLMTNNLWSFSYSRPLWSVPKDTEPS